MNRQIPAQRIPFKLHADALKIFYFTENLVGEHARKAAVIDAISAYFKIFEIQLSRVLRHYRGIEAHYFWGSANGLADNDDGGSEFRGGDCGTQA